MRHVAALVRALWSLLISLVPFAHARTTGPKASRIRLPRAPLLVTDSSGMIHTIWFPRASIRSPPKRRGMMKRKICQERVRARDSPT